MSNLKRAVCMSFKPTKRKIQKVNKKWYDKDYRSLLKELKSINVFNRNVFNDDLRMKYYKNTGSIKS